VSSLVDPMSAQAQRLGEPAAADWDWHRLDTELRPRLIKLAMARYGFSREDSEDLVQDVFQRVLIKRHRARCPEAYLRTAFYHRCADLMRDKSRRGAVPLTDDLSDDPLPRILAAVAVNGALRRVSPTCRSLIVAYYLERQTLAETAVDIAASVKAAWKRINRCVSRLLQCLR